MMYVTPLPGRVSKELLSSQVAPKLQVSLDHSSPVVIVHILTFCYCTQLDMLNGRFNDSERSPSAVVCGGTDTISLETFGVVIAG